MIRQAEQKDIQSCIEILKHDEWWTRFNRDDSVLENKVRNELPFTYVFEENKNVVGFIVPAFGMGLGRVYIITFAIHPHYRKQGNGTKMICYLKEILFPGIPIFLVCDEKNYKAHNFYLKNEFIRIGEIPDLIQDGKKEVLFYHSNKIKKNIDF